MTAELQGNGFAGITTILGHRLNTTGMLGVSKLGGQDVVRAFPSWATVPSGQHHRHGAIDLFCDNLRAYLDGGPLRNVIDWERGY